VTAAPWSLGDEYRQERILELEALRDDLLTMLHAPGCPGWVGCWCPLGKVAGLVEDRVDTLQAGRD
jgi:hypothetical protein